MSRNSMVFHGIPQISESSEIFRESVDICRQPLRISRRTSWLHFVAGEALQRQAPRRLRRLRWSRRDATLGGGDFPNSHWYSEPFTALPWHLQNYIQNYIQSVSVRFYHIWAYLSISEHIWARCCEVNSLPEQFLNWTTLSSLQNVFDQVRIVPKSPRSSDSVPVNGELLESLADTGETVKLWNHSIQTPDSVRNPSDSMPQLPQLSWRCHGIMASWCSWCHLTGQLRLLLGSHKCCGAHGTCRDLPITTAELFSSGAERHKTRWVFVLVIPEKVDKDVLLCVAICCSFRTLPSSRLA